MKHNPLQSEDWLNNQWAVTVLGGLILAGLSWLIPSRWHKYRNKVRCRYLSNSRSDKERFTKFYYDNVEEVDRISPDKITKWLGNSSYSAFSKSEVKQKWMNGTTPIHLLLVAEAAGKIVGFCKCIALKESNSLYIGYLVTKSDSVQESVSGRLLEELQEIMNDLPSLAYAIFEICGDCQRAQSRWRLFFDTANQRQLRLWRLPEYWIPVEDEADLTTAFDNPRWPGFLGIIPLRNSNKPICLDGFEAGRFVLDMYFRVYLYMARDITDERTEYDSYLTRLYAEWYGKYGQGVELQTGRYLLNAPSPI